MTLPSFLWPKEVKSSYAMLSTASPTPNKKPWIGLGLGPFLSAQPLHKNLRSDDSPELLSWRNGVQIRYAHEPFVRLIHGVPADQARV